MLDRAFKLLWLPTWGLTYLFIASLPALRVAAVTQWGQVHVPFPPWYSAHDNSLYWEYVEDA